MSKHGDLIGKAKVRGLAKGLHLAVDAIDALLEDPDIPEEWKARFGPLRTAKWAILTKRPASLKKTSLEETRTNVPSW